MRHLITLLGLLLLTACGTPVKTNLQPSESGGSRSEGIVIHSSTNTLFTPVNADWSIADASALKRCRAWGYDGVSTFTGSQQMCRRYDRYGRCVKLTMNRFYECEG